MIDVDSVRAFEGEHSAMYDALAGLKRLKPPKESEGVEGLAKWFRDFQQILTAGLPDTPATLRLTRFAQGVEIALGDQAGERSPVPKPPSTVMLPTPRGFWAEIVTEVGSGAYTFKEKRLTDGTTWADKSGGRTGTVYEVNDRAGLEAGAIIRVTVERDTSGTLRYVCEAAIAAIRWDTTAHKHQYMLQGGTTWIDITGGTECDDT